MTPDIAIIGGGAAGIGAARAAAAAGRSALIVEAGPRLGGRAHTVVAGGHPVDLGCGWLHSAERNPWVGIAEGSGFTVDRTPTAWGAQWRDLGFPRAEQAAARDAFARFDDRLRAAARARAEGYPAATDRAADLLRPGDRWNPYLQALSGYINGVELSALSIADYLAYDDAASEVNWRVREGYGALVAASIPPPGGRVTVALDTPATAIAEDAHGVTIETPRGAIRAGAAIVTVSSAVLASGAIRFTPALDDHLHAASRLPLGLADKVFLSVAGPIDDLDPDTHLLGDPRRAGTGSYYLRPFGRPLIEGFFGGPGARNLEGAGRDATAAFAIDELVALLGGDWRPRLTPLAASAWRHDPLFGGSYSHALPGHADTRALLATPPSQRLAFAGEACSESDFSTAHGAYATGVLAAGLIAPDE
ncbi:NAD(P)/FAD-dependent oxidoreductase [Sphingomonas naphthae]|uniref:Tryptophan 2-monooxygenase n=1 Tax=Sphingomonas naphthae TaxID=1813468 RepID=A0ABY7TL92_9SPHN|nr:NAD(P)/FAD-dependent oxidoreductase [Sphingomonas naphthae]WCT74012.1 NAD(P)/FAD-dependent oxidoreductase [Sphingomonas naphthae]